MNISRGLEGVIVDTTRISLVDGVNGVLSYRGCNVENLIDKPFGHVAGLVIDGECSAALSDSLHAASTLSERETDLICALPESTQPMHVLQGVTPLLDATDHFAERGEAAQGFAVAAKLPSILATFLLGRRPDACAVADPAERFLRQIGAPDSDADAVELLNLAWFKQSERNFEHIEIIDTAPQTHLHDRWSAFTPTLHYHVMAEFEQCRIARWPRRSCESLFYPMTQGLPCEDFPLPSTDNIVELRAYAADIAQHEDGPRIHTP